VTVVLNVAVVTLFPEMFKAVTEFGVTGRAVSNGLVNVSVINPRDHTDDPHRSVDDRPYGGGPGMVIRVEPLQNAIRFARLKMPDARVIYLSPQGKKLEQSSVKQLAELGDLILISGRYEGVDQRLIDLEVDEEWSIGDYVVSGGEIPAMVIIDAMARTIPGVLGDSASAEEDSFVEGILDCPHYTRPEEIAGQSVPEVLLSGDHEAIRLWRLKQALGKTWKSRPDLLEKLELSEEQSSLLAEFKNDLKSV
jgi:tRNA (guanine37-N1)-methyltransferase